MGWWIALGVLTLIAILPIGVSAHYDGDGPRVFLLTGPVRIQVYPQKKHRKKEKPPKIQKNKTDESTGKKADKQVKGGSIQDFLPLVDLVLDFLSDFGRKLRVNHLQMKLILAGSDPDVLAANYGRGWAILGNLIPLLENAFIIKRRDLEVECDFLGDKTTITARLDITITIGRLFFLLIVRGIPIFRELLKQMKTRKGGAKA